MAANIEKSAQHAIVPPHYNDGFTRDICGHKLAWFFHLLDSANHLPGFAEDSFGLQFRNAVIDIPGRRNGRGFGKRRTVVISGKDLLH